MWPHARVQLQNREDDALAGHAWRALRVSGTTREEFSPLIYQVFAGHLACHLARGLGRKPFQSDLRRVP